MIGLQSRVGLGTAPLGSRVDGPLWWGPQDPADAVAAVRAALDAGVDWIDTAPFYGWGLAEELVGRAIAGRRDEVRILTKCGTVRRPDGRAAEDASPAAVRAGLRESLRRLGTDHVDVLQVHDPDPATPIEQTWAAIAELVTEGLVRDGGLSNHPVELMERAHAVRAGRGRAAPVLGAAPGAGGGRRAGLVCRPRQRVPGLVAAGLRLPHRRVRPGHARPGRPAPPPALGGPRNMTGQLGRLAAVAARDRVPAHRVALAWATRRPGTYAIVGARTAAEAADLRPLPTLSPADVAAIA